MKRTALRKVGRKRARELAKYWPLRKKFLEEHPTCQSCREYTSHEIHHKMGQGKYMNVTETWLALCADCHSYIEGNKKWARKEGLILYK